MQVQGEAASGDDVTDRIEEDLSDDMAGNQQISDVKNPTPFAPAAALASDDFDELEESNPESAGEDEDETPKTAEVIALDAFRKK